MKTPALKIIFGICVLFIISGAVNYGVSRFYFAIPFYVIAFVLSLKIFPRPKGALYVLALVFASIFINTTLEFNPLVFPILNGGYVEVVNDRLQNSSSEDTESFSNKNRSRVECTQCGFKNKMLVEGYIYRVTGVKVSHRDFSTNVTLLTEVGEFTEYEYKTNRVVIPNKRVNSILFEKLRILMAYPLFLVNILSPFSN